MTRMKSKGAHINHTVCSNPELIRHPDRLILSLVCFIARPSSTKKLMPICGSAWDAPDATTEHTQDRDETKLGELRIFGHDGELWKSFELHEVSPGKWKISTPIEL